MNKHTPGPWRRGQEGNLRIYGPDTTEHAGLIATIVRGSDAHLIAAAPEMYEALRLVWNSIDRVSHPASVAIKYALAKAEGR